MEEGLNRITENIIGAAIQGRRALGLAFLECVHEARLSLGLTERGLKVEKENLYPRPIVRSNWSVDIAPMHLS